MACRTATTISSSCSGSTSDSPSSSRTHSRCRLPVRGMGGRRRLACCAPSPSGRLSVRRRVSAAPSAYQARPADAGVAAVARRAAVDEDPSPSMQRMLHCRATGSSRHRACPVRYGGAWSAPRLRPPYKQLAWLLAHHRVGAPPVADDRPTSLRRQHRLARRGGRRRRPRSASTWPSCVWPAWSAAAARHLRLLHRRRRARAPAAGRGAVPRRPRPARPPRPRDVDRSPIGRQPSLTPPRRRALDIPVGLIATGSQAGWETACRPGPRVHPPHGRDRAARDLWQARSTSGPVTEARAFGRQRRGRAGR